VFHVRLLSDAKRGRRASVPSIECGTPARSANLLVRAALLSFIFQSCQTALDAFPRLSFRETGEMRTSLIALAMAGAATLAAPAAAQTRADEQRWQDAQRRFDAERAIYERERDRYEQARRRAPYGNYRDYDRRYDDPYATEYDAARYYRDDPRYQERVLTAEDQVYRGSDGRYYCRRSDGTTGLVVGGVGGALIGNVIDGGRHRTAGTLIGGALGALMGRAIEQNADVRCR
jgi:hypothetical protein